MPESNTRDDAILLLCEELEHTLQTGIKEIRELSAEDQEHPIDRRFRFILERIETERRLIEEVSAPCRYMFEHLSLLLDEMEFTVGFHFRELRSGRGLLNGLKVSPWGTITIKVGDVEITWRDHEVFYMFYPDKVIIRARDRAEDDITLYFSYALKYALNLLRAYQEVQNHPQTLYWHESLILDK